MPNTNTANYELEHQVTVLKAIETRIAQDGVHTAKPHADRARQFMPFAALKGYEELVAEAEIIPDHVAENPDDFIC